MYSSSQLDVLIILKDLTASLSLLGCLFIVLVYFYFKDLRVFAFKLVLHMTIGDGVRCIGLLLSPVSYPLCVLQGMLVQAGSISSILWNGVIARMLYISVVMGVQDLEELELRYTLSVYTLVGSLTALPWATNGYNDAEGWCWITTDGTHYITGNVWRGVCFFFPLCFVVINNIYSYIRVIRTLKTGFLHDDAAVDALIRKLKFYPLILVVCYTCTGTKRIYDVVNPEEDDFGLAVLAILMLGTIGFADAMVYGFTQSVRTVIGQKFCPMKYSSRTESTESNHSFL